nr:EOG090X03TX [Triops cancriformis]
MIATAPSKILKDRSTSTVKSTWPGNLNNNEEEKLAILSELESIFTLYCKSHNLKYDRTEQWPRLLMPLMSLKLSVDELYLCFVAIKQRYIPKEDLFSLRSQGRQVMLDFLTSLPANLEADDVADLMSVAVFYSSKTPSSFQMVYGDVLFGNITDPELHHSLSLSLSQDLCLPIVVEELLAATGQSSSSNSKDAPGPKFFLVDCRPPEQYNAGHLPTAFHLDCSLMLQDPGSFYTAVSGLLSAQKGALAARSAAGGEHLCFTGSGLPEHVEEDGLLHMAISSFLQKHVPYVSELRSGFTAVHQAWEAEQKNPLVPWSLADHRPDICVLCAPKQLKIDTKSNGNAANSTAKSVSATQNKSPDFFDKLRGKLMDYIVNPGAANTRGSATATGATPKSNDGTKSKGKDVVERHVSSRDRTKRRYRNMAPVFSIDDEQDEDSSGCADEDSDGGGDVVPISSWLQKPDVLGSFRCQEVRGNGQVHSAYLLVTETHLFALRELPDSTNKGMARVTVRRGLTSIVKITSKKRHPELISFKYGTSEGEEVTITDMDRFLIPNAGDATKLVKLQIMKALESEMAD